eukprot:3526975-Alexandrium_andersonii.AAC.1
MTSRRRPGRPAFASDPLSLLVMFLRLPLNFIASASSAALMITHMRSLGRNSRPWGSVPGWP